MISATQPIQARSVEHKRVKSNTTKNIGVTKTLLVSINHTVCDLPPVFKSPKFLFVQSDFPLFQDVDQPHGLKFRCFRLAFVQFQIVQLELATRENLEILENGKMFEDSYS